MLGVGSLLQVFRKEVRGKRTTISKVDDPGGSSSNFNGPTSVDHELYAFRLRVFVRRSRSKRPFLRQRNPWLEPVNARIRRRHGRIGP